MAQLIPVTNDVRQTFTTVLATQRVRLGIYYLDDVLDEARNAWYCNLTLLSDTPQIITTGYRLQSRQRIARDIVSNFVGSIVVVPITSPSQDLTTTNPWNSTHELVYFTNDEVSL
jgi:hypothetical protein